MSPTRTKGPQSGMEIGIEQFRTRRRISRLDRMLSSPVRGPGVRPCSSIRATRQNHTQTE